MPVGEDFLIMACLTPEQIEKLACKELQPEEATELQAHVEQCDTCRAKLDECLANEEHLRELKQDGVSDFLEQADSPEPPRLTQGIYSAEAGETVPAGAGGHGPSFTSPPPDSFAGYNILREIHRGGQGVVYQAIQKSTKRKVAIKVMKEGPFAGRSDRARFEREVEILGQLNHPNIVAIHDSGTAAGAFYFVMDYISGQPLDVRMASGERSIEGTLRLFAKICEAVNAAHLRGVIHRDLKPGNIRIDGEGEPHVLDFGLAKVAVGHVTNGSQPQAMTMTGQFMGSLPWASPEQAEAIPGKIDIRTDVYALGVILYQMLTGKFPYEVVGNMRDVLDNILKAEPAKPSTIRKQINDEVETIVLKCLSKERERRYQTAGELARDIGHYLSGEPIEAKRDSAWYVLRKSIRRYRLQAAIGLLIIVLGLATSITVKHYRDEVMIQEARRKRELAQTVKDRLTQAQSLFLLGKYEGAKRLAEQCLEDHPNSQDATLLLVQVAHELLEPQQALGKIGSLLGSQLGWTDKNLGQIHLRLASLHRRLGNGDDEQLHAGRAKSLLVHRADLHYAQALLCTVSSEAMAELDKGLSEDQYHFDALVLKAYLNLAIVGDLDAAVKLAERALDLRPRDPKPRYVLAACLLYQGHVFRASERLGDAKSHIKFLELGLLPPIRVETGDHSTLFARNTGSWDLELIEEHIEASPEDIYAYVDRAKILLVQAVTAEKQGRVREARTMRSRARSDFLYSAEKGIPYALMMRCHFRSLSIRVPSEEVLSDADALIYAGWHSFHMVKGAIQATRLQKNQAIDAFDSALRIDPDNAIAHLAKAMIHYYFWRIGQHESSLDTIRTHIDQAAYCCSPTLGKLLSFFAAAIRRSDGTAPESLLLALVKPALPLGETVLYIQQPNAKNWATLSKRILFSVPPPTRDDATALRFYRHRLEYDQGHLVTLLGIARLQLESHEPKIKSADEALRYARRAVKLAPDYGACHLLLGDVYLYFDRPAESVREFQKAIELDGEDVHYLLRRAVAEYRSGQRGQAVETLSLAEEAIGEFDEEDVGEVAPLLDTATSEIRGDFAVPRERP